MHDHGHSTCQCINAFSTFVTPPNQSMYRKHVTPKNNQFQSMQKMQTHNPSAKTGKQMCWSSKKVTISKEQNSKSWKTLYLALMLHFYSKWTFSLVPKPVLIEAFIEVTDNFSIHMSINSCTTQSCTKMKIIFLFLESK